MRIALKTKLTLMSLLLVVVPVAIIGVFSIYELQLFTGDSTTQSYEGMKEQVGATLLEGVGGAWEAMNATILHIENLAGDLAVSANVEGYITSIQGKNEMINTMIRREIGRILSGIATTCQAQKKLLDRKLAGDFQVAKEILSRQGIIQLRTDVTQEWNAINQYSGESTTVALPVLALGDVGITPNATFDQPSPVVDTVKTMVGDVCTIFQRMNDAGDMLRVMTSVATKEGARAIGTYIPVQMPDGAPNKVLESVLAGKPYLGRAFVVDAWYETFYEPITDPQGQIIGMFFVGVKEQDSTELVDAITSIKIGNSGYPFVIDSKGQTIVHPRANLIGKNIVTEIGLKEFEQAITNKAAGEMKEFSYAFEGRDKLVVYTYFADWDWIICASAYWDELSIEASTFTMDMLKAQVERMYQSTTLEAKGEMIPICSQIRILNEKGMEIFNLQYGKFTDDLKDKSDTDWFAAAKEAKKGEVVNCGVVVAANTGKPEMRIVSPVIVNDVFRGASVISVDWIPLAELVSRRQFGKTGYAYMLNDQGIAVAHPKFSLADNANIADPKYGELAKIVKEQMLKGNTGVCEYLFDGSVRFGAYRPIVVGGKTFTIAASCPRSEVMERTENIKAAALKMSRQVLILLVSAGAVLAFLGGLLGFFVSRGIARPVRGIADSLHAGASQVASAAGQISGASQELASAATRQSATVEETAASLEQITSMSKSTTELTQSASQLMRENIERSKQSLIALGDMTRQMQEVNAAGSEMSKIIKTIDEIAFQTNLLALNAAVEAARAGEHGKGFAVVAEEVRNLARRAADAAKNTQTMLEGTISRVGATTKAIGSINQNFESIVQSASEMGEKLDAVTNASHEVARGIEQINAATSEMSQAVQGVAASSEETASSSEELAAQADTMRAAVVDLVALVEGSKAAAERVQEGGALPGLSAASPQAGLIRQDPRFYLEHQQEASDEE